MATFKTRTGRLLKVKDQVIIDRLRTLNGLVEIEGEKTEKEIRSELFAQIALLDVKQPAKNAKTDDLKAIIEANNK